MTSRLPPARGAPPGRLRPRGEAVEIRVVESKPLAQLRQCSERNITNSGVTAVGHNPVYITEAKSRGASYGDAWNGLTTDQRWAANTRFLDTRIAAKDHVLLSVPKDDFRPGSYLVAEVEYLTENNYHWINQRELVANGSP